MLGFFFYFIFLFLIWWPVEAPSQNVEAFLHVSSPFSGWAGVLAVLWELGDKPCRIPQQGRGMFQIQYLEERSAGNLHSETTMGRYADYTTQLWKQLSYAKAVNTWEKCYRERLCGPEIWKNKAIFISESLSRQNVPDGAFWGSTTKLESASQLWTEFIYTYIYICMQLYLYVFPPHAEFPL